MNNALVCLVSPEELFLFFDDRGTGRLAFKSWGPGSLLVRGDTKKKLSSLIS